MKKITEFRVTKLHTRYLKDQFGNRIQHKEEIEINRPVMSVENGPRFGHFIVDLIVYQIIIYTIQYFFDLFSDITLESEKVNLTVQFINSIVIILAYPLFYFIFEHYWQRTPGKFLTKTLVIDEYGNKPDARALLLRSFLRFVPFGAFSCLGDTYSRGWHDKWSDTWVVTEVELAELKKLQGQSNEEKIDSKTVI